ncbi:hypothetical protein [Rehaibacterium terrae]|jgi:hypothetical protein|uniref:Uncharacterized protein n=1 Tax=Rehaibacterium terrae TaxID=1341696 RepID=A0A7W7XZI9_9GAMM|nr:hypothetical protein [Rehaibacterium terrae]MBB5015320.1 hypothetical protein [Rehaibacterium terrae]
MGRTVLAVIAGLLAMAVVVFAVEALGHRLYPLPPGIDLDDPASVQSMVDAMPLAAKLLVVLGWALGSFVGAHIAVRLTPAHRRGAALSIGVAMVVLVAINASMIPHPLWMTALGLLLPIPLALSALRMAGRARA